MKCFLSALAVLAASLAAPAQCPRGACPQSGRAMFPRVFATPPVTAGPVGGWINCPPGRHYEYARGCVPDAQTYTLRSGVVTADGVDDPYGIDDYDTFRGRVEAGNPWDNFRLLVGDAVKDRYRHSYVEHCRVPSGFKGYADGEYRCFGRGGLAYMEPVTTATTFAPAPFGGLFASPFSRCGPGGCR